MCLHFSPNRSRSTISVQTQPPPADGRNLSVDAKFWQKHEQLLQQLPEEMRPKWDNVGMKVSAKLPQQTSTAIKASLNSTHCTAIQSHMNSVWYG
jgi:hypothetical protein